MVLRRVIAGGFLFACQSPSDLLIDVPPDVDLVAVADSTTRRATPLESWSHNEPLPIALESGSAWLLGFDSSKLPVPPDQNSPLEFAGTCDSVLPPAAWSTRFDAHGTLPATEPAPTLSAAWLDDVCVRPATHELIADIDCRLDRCRPRAAYTDTCELSFDLRDCDLFEAEARLRTDGDCISMPQSRWTCNERLKPDLATFSLQCVSEDVTCGVDLFLSPPQPVFDLERIPVGPSAAFLPDWLDYQNLLRAEILVLGTAHDVAAFGDDVVATTSDQPVFTCGAAPSPSHWYRISSTGSVTTSTAPPCLTRLRATEDELVGTFFDNGSFSLGRFDSDGNLGASTSFEANPHLEVVADIIATPTSYWILLAQTLGPGRIVEIARHTLAPIRTTSLDASAWRGCVLGENQVALNLDRPRAVSIRSDDADELERRPLPRRLGSDFDSLLGIACDGAQFWTSLTKRAAFLEGTSLGPATRSTFPFDLDADPVEALVTQNSVWVTTAVNLSGSLEARLHRLDRRSGRFAPWSLRLGHGVATRPTLDHQGRLIVILPWANEVVRVSLPDD